MSAATVARCECGNVASVGLLCEWCDSHSACVMPEGMTKRQARMSGTPVAHCLLCGWTCGYWECACDLAHECLSGSCDVCCEPYDPSDREDHCADCGTCWEHCPVGHVPAFEW